MYNHVCVLKRGKFTFASGGTTLLTLSLEDNSDTNPLPHTWTRGPARKSRQHSGVANPTKKRSALTSLVSVDKNRIKSRRIS